MKTFANCAAEWIGSSSVQCPRCSNSTATLVHASTSKARKRKRGKRGEIIRPLHLLQFFSEANFFLANFDALTILSNFTIHCHLWCSVQ